MDKFKKSGMPRPTCPGLIALQLLEKDPDTSIRDLQGKTGLPYNQVSLIKKSFDNPEVLDRVMRKLTLQHMKDESDIAISKALISEHHKFEVDDDRPIGISFIADMHIGNTGTSISKMEDDFQTVRDTDGMYAALGGDYTDNFIKDSIISATISSTSTPNQQLLVFEEMLEIIEPKVIALIEGNHDLWTNKLSGISPIKRLCKSKRIKYAPHQLRIEVNFPTGQSYAIGLRHQALTNSNLNAGHAVKSWRRNTTSWPFDIGVICHNHCSMVESFIHESQEHWAVRPGSYKLIDDYATQFGFPRAVSAMPVVILYPNERRILAFTDIQAGAEVLTALRNNSPRRKLGGSVVKSKKIGHNSKLRKGKGAK